MAPGPLSSEAISPSENGTHPAPTGAQFSQQDGPLPALIDIEAVSHSLGISMRQVRRFVAEGTMPFVRVGHLIRFDPDELNRWIDARRSGSIRAT